MQSTIDIVVWDREEGDGLGRRDLGPNCSLSLPWVKPLCPVVVLMVSVCFSYLIDHYEHPFQA